LYLPDFRNNLLIDLKGENCHQQMRNYCNQSFQFKDTQRNPHFHGFHCMTRESFNQIGGFTEEFYGRAFADDKMTRLGYNQPGPVGLPHEFSVAWCGGYEILNRGPGLPENWKDTWYNKDPWAGQRPTPGDRTSAKYLHDGMFGNGPMAKLVNETFVTMKPPVRIK